MRTAEKKRARRKWLMKVELELKATADGGETCCEYFENLYITK